jgi:hypothetical protein
MCAVVYLLKVHWPLEVAAELSLDFGERGSPASVLHPTIRKYGLLDGRGKRWGGGCIVFNRGARPEQYDRPPHVLRPPVFRAAIARAGILTETSISWVLVVGGHMGPALFSVAVLAQGNTRDSGAHFKLTVSVCEEKTLRILRLARAALIFLLLAIRREEALRKENLPMVQES